MDFLNILKGQILTEGLIPMGSKKTVAMKQIIAYMQINEPFIHFILTEKTNWYFSDKADDTAFIGWDPKAPKKLMLGFGPKCYNGTREQIAFVIAHEFAHFFRGHVNFNINQGKPNHKIANYAEDALINDDVLRSGKFAGINVMPPFPTITLKTEEYKGMKQNWLEGPEYVNETYSGPILSQGVYKWLVDNWDKIIDNQKKNQKDDDGQEGEGQEGDDSNGQGQGDGLPNFPKNGDIVFNKTTGQYGKVVTVDQAGKKVTKVFPMEKSDAEAEVLKKGLRS